MEYNRPYYQNINYHPLLFYVIFHIQEDSLQISRERHHVDELPEGLDMIIYHKAQHKEYMELLLGGTLGSELKRKDPALYDQAYASEKWVIIRGEVKHDETLSYMRNAIGIVQAFVESGAIGVLDLQTFTLYSAKQWTEDVFSKEFDANKHVTILLSEMEDGTVWLHTRGMRKFGRPDISMEKVEKDSIQDAAQLMNQMIYYGSLGVFFDVAAKLHIPDRKTYIVKPDFINDFENDDFNNAYYKLIWDACERIE